MSSGGERLAAINPIQWPGFDRVGTEEWDAMLGELAELGFAAVALQSLDADGAALELTQLRARELQPAPGYWEVAAQPGGPMVEQLAAAGRAIDANAAAGLDAMFIACEMVQEREHRPNDFNKAEIDPARLAWIAELFNRVGERAASSGIAACLHQHVGTTIQSGAELEAVLAATDPELVFFGPDTGHMAWAEIDVVGTLESHAARIRALHLKDVRTERAEESAQEGWTYWQAEKGGVWAAPGTGSLDLEAMLDAAGPSLGWVIAEVDCDPLVSPRESSGQSRRWLSEYGAN
jgi:inosose dehydratase